MTGTALLSGGPRQRRPPDPGDGTSTAQAQEDPNTIKRPPLGSDQRCVEVLPVTTPSDAQGPTTTPSGTRPVAPPPSSSSAPRTYAAALTSSSLAAERSSEGLPTIRQLKPDLPPDVLAKLSNTLEKDWNTSRKLQLSPELESLQAVALKESRVHSDYMLRERTPVETQALMAYFRGDLDLRHPPSFLKATMPVIQPAMVEQFHETHVEATLTADIPPQVPLRKGMTHLALFEELFNSNQNVRHGKEMIDRMMRDVKMLYFDGNHTLNFVFYSRRTAEFYNGISLRLQRVVIDLEDSSGLEDGAYNSAQLRRFYSIRVLNAADLGIATLVSAFSQLAGVPVLDAERPRAEATKVVDNRYFVVRFAQEQCPDSLQGVTQVTIGTTPVILHHFLVQQRHPCGRCFSPKHTTGYCRVKAEHLMDARNRGCRVFQGYVAPFQVGAAQPYRHTDEDSFNTFWATMAKEMEHPAEASPTAVTLQRLPQPALAAPESGTDPNPQRADHAPGNADVRADTTTDGDFTIVRRRNSKKKTSVEEELPATPTNSTKGVTRTLVAPMRSEVPLSSPRTSTPRLVKKKTKVSRGGDGNREPFRLFQKAREYGQFQAQMEEDCISESNVVSIGHNDSDDDDQDTGPDDAGYAFPDEADSADQDVVMEAEEFERQASASTTKQPDASAAEQQRSAQRASRRQQAVTEAVERTEYIELAVSRNASARPPSVATGVYRVHAQATSPESSYLGSSAPSQSPPLASTPSSGVPCSLVSSSSDLTSNELAQRVPEGQGCQMSDASQATDASVVLEKILPSSTSPTQATYWLSGFHGMEVSVPADGQCAILAMYATVSNQEHGRLSLTPAVIAEANFHKKAIYALMVENLQADCDLGIVDPFQELDRLNPGCAHPKTKEAAIAMVCTYLLHERLRSVDTRVPCTNWVNPHVLRTYAQYLRQPLLVMDVDTHGDGHLQIYTYQDFELERPGDSEPLIHATGSYTALTDHEATKYLRVCRRLHVLPTFMLLRTHESHFYGVQHGELFYKWQAEGDPGFAAEVAHPYDWRDGFLARPTDVVVTKIGEASRTQVGFEVQVGGIPLDLLDDTNDTNAHLHRSLTMRQRLDVAHLRMDWPILDDREYQVEEMEVLMQEAERRIFAAAGMDDYAVGRRRSQMIAAVDLPTKQRFQPSGQIHTGVYQALLNASSPNDLTPALRIKLQAAQHDNTSAIGQWYTETYERFSLPPPGREAPSLEGFMLQHGANLEALRDLFAFIPFPELAAKTAPPQQLQLWGRMEAYHSQLGALRRLVQDPDHPKELREMSRQWLDNATGSDLGNNLKMAADENGWASLGKWLADKYLRGQPCEMQDSVWATLHVLPHVVRQWGAKPMGRAPLGALAQWYATDPLVEQSCRDVVRGNWGAVLKLHTGLTWDELADASKFRAALSTRK